MDVGRQRAMVRKSAATCKHQGGALLSASKVGAKATPKGKNNSKDDRLSKTGTGLPLGISKGILLHPLPLPRYGVGKGLMTRKGPVAPSPV